MLHWVKSWDIMLCFFFRIWIFFLCLLSTYYRYLLVFTLDGVNVFLFSMLDNSEIIYLVAFSDLYNILLFFQHPFNNSISWLGKHILIPLSNINFTAFKPTLLIFFRGYSFSTLWHIKRKLFSSVILVQSIYILKNTCCMIIIAIYLCVCNSFWSTAHVVC